MNKVQQIWKWLSMTLLGIIIGMIISWLLGKGSINKTEIKTRKIKMKGKDNSNLNQDIDNIIKSNRQKKRDKKERKLKLFRRKKNE